MTSCLNRILCIKGDGREKNNRVYLEIYKILFRKWKLSGFALLRSRFHQKINYIHQNPVRAGFVGSVHEYWYSSANPQSLLNIIYNLSWTLKLLPFSETLEWTVKLLEGKGAKRLVLLLQTCYCLINTLYIPQHPIMELS
jgi:hypothetical protein